MKLILTQDVSGLGAPGDVVEVKDGYGRNYLLPRSHATPWTKGGEKQVAQIKRARQVREVRDIDRLNNCPLTDGEMQQIILKKSAIPADAQSITICVAKEEG